MVLWNLRARTTHLTLHSPSGQEVLTSRFALGGREVVLEALKLRWVGKSLFINPGITLVGFCLFVKKNTCYWLFW